MPTSLQQELKMRRPFESREQEAALNLARTNDRLQIEFTRLFRQHGITPAQFNILRILRGAGEPLPSLEVAERLVTVVPGITGLIDRLERLELVCRKRPEADRRVVLVELTRQGRAVLAALDTPVLELHRTLLGHLSQRELRQLNSLLDKARAGLET
ncbi:MAG: MarR family transcriptional regulator [Candidatus Hydrogenedentes bacterium]|nr:MarR family transcriptional regulator [Candidatus Hydrogenedentota bacterium]MBI3119942.1 MarR family transcriptional regulator [Candidatus Hydrogenedentota bacterium]